MKDFDPAFASAAEHAAYYRDLKWQIVPAMPPSQTEAWKRPAVKWREHEDDLVDQDTFDSWFGPNGKYRSYINLGMITGDCSGVFILDLDTHKHPEADQWFRGLLAVHNNNMQIETPTQRTGGGGLQLVFRYPVYYTPPTCKTPIGVDIRGKGGFAVLAPSKHQSGRYYAWLEGLAPWEISVAMAPDWLLEAIDKLVSMYGANVSSASTGPVQSLPAPSNPTTLSGQLLDGREDYMTRLIWAKVVDMYRESPIPLGTEASVEQMRDAFGQYEQNAKSRIREPGTPNHILLERENRGIGLFQSKWQIAMKQWDTRVREAASRPSPSRLTGLQALHSSVIEVAAPRYDPDTGEIIEDDPADYAGFELLDRNQIYDLPDPTWLIEGMLIENGLAIVAGPPGCGKSFITIGMALSIASKLPQWFGRNIVRSGPVLYISAEGVGDLKYRMQAWEKATGVKTEDTPFYLVRQTINFMAEPDIDRLLITVQRMVTLTGETPALIVVDTVSRVLPGADENLQKDMTRFVRACDILRETFNTSVMGVHHTSKGGELRGSTVIPGAGDFIGMVHRESGEEVGTIFAQKIKAAPDGWTMPFRLSRIALDLQGTASLFAEPSNEPVATQQDDAWPTKKKLTDILVMVDQAFKSNQAWSTAPQTRADGRYFVVNVSNSQSVSAKIAQNIMDEWLRTGILERTITDAHSKKMGLTVREWPEWARKGYQHSED